MRYVTNSLEVRPFCENDRENMIDLFMSDVVNKTYMLPDFSSREEAGKLFDRMVTLSNTDGKYVSGIILQGNCIGMVNETGIEGDKIELGYAIVPRFHGFGYATEMLRGAIMYLFEHGFREVIAGAFEENRASTRVMEKAGMIRIDKTEDIEYRGAVHHCVYYHICSDRK